MTSVFADTFFFIALLAPNDERHEEALGIVDRLRSPIITSSWVLTEVADGFSSRQTRAAFGSLLDMLSANPLVTILPVDEEIFHRAVELYRERSDKDWSLTDCRSFVIMSELGLREALTGAGILSRRALLR
jgi:predicted nucleic acid-binding protein